MALCKANSQGPSVDTLVSQDLLLGEGGGLEKGDHIEARYTGWLFADNILGQVKSLCTLKHLKSAPLQIVVWIYNTFEDNLEI